MNPMEELYQRQLNSAMANQQYGNYPPGLAPQMGLSQGYPQPMPAPVKQPESQEELLLLLGDEE